MSDYSNSDAHHHYFSDTERPPRKRPAYPEMLLVVLLVLGLYCYSCTISVMLDGNNYGWGRAGAPGPLKPVLGSIALGCGWFPPYTIAWSANPFLLVGIGLYGRRLFAGAAVCGILGVLAGASTLLLPLVQEHIAVDTGYAFWQSALTLFAAAAWNARSRNRPTGDTDLSLSVGCN